jgi:hypothetical protein
MNPVSKLRVLPAPSSFVYWTSPNSNWSWDAMTCTPSFVMMNSARSVPWNNVRVPRPMLLSPRWNHTSSPYGTSVGVCISSTMPPNTNTHGPVSCTDTGVCVGAGVEEGVGVWIGVAQPNNSKRRRPASAPRIDLDQPPDVIFDSIAISRFFQKRVPLETLRPAGSDIMRPLSPTFARRSAHDT